MDVNYFTILYWFCHTSTWICHRYTCVPHPEPPSLLPPRTIPLGRLSPPAPSIQYHASNLDWWLFHIWYYTCFNAILPNHATLSLSHRVQKTVLYISVLFLYFAFHDDKWWWASFMFIHHLPISFDEKSFQVFCWFLNFYALNFCSFSSPALFYFSVVLDTLNINLKSVFKYAQNIFLEFSLGLCLIYSWLGNICIFINIESSIP